MNIQWPSWMTTMVVSALILAGSWLAGRVTARFLSRRVPRRLVDRWPGLAESVRRILRSRLPLWFLLAGVWLASGFWPLNPQARGLLERALFAVAGLSVTFSLVSLTTQAIGAYGALVKPTLPVTTLSRNVAGGLIGLIGVLVVLNGLGISITPMLAALGVGGLAVALALQEPLANFFAGVFITLGGQVRVGDYVQLDSGQEGYVVDFSWRSTRLRMLANNLIVVPNARLAQAIIVNHHLPSQDLAVLVNVGVDYGSNLEHVERVVNEVARDTMTGVAGGVETFEPFIRFHTFGESSIDFTVILRGKEFVDQYLVKHEFIKRLHARFNHEGIVIPFPIRTIVQRLEPANEGPQREGVRGAA